MSDPLALLPLAIAAGGGRLGNFDAASLVAAGLTLLQRSAPLVRILATTRSAILLPSGPAFLVALAGSDGRGALLLDPRDDAPSIARQLTDAQVGAVFTCEALRPLLPPGTPVVLLDQAPRVARVELPGRHMDVDLGSHHGLALEGDTATEGRDEECLITATPTAAGRVHTHRDLIAMGRATVTECLLTPVDHVWSLLPSFHPASIAVGLVAPLLAGARVTTRPATELADMLAAVEHDGITMVAGQWRTPTGPRLALLGTAHAIPALREGTLILADR
jgi:acyl-CoA synthetase (AMP-forming)/AMP-acid ligase II